MTCVLLEKHLCFFFHPKFMFLGAVSGLFSAGCWASAESQDFMVMFYSCFVEWLFLVCSE